MAKKWTLNNQRAAVDAGWGLFRVSTGPKIERIDCPEDGSDPVFDDDESALAYVRERARKGHRLALKALGFLGETEAVEEGARAIERRRRAKARRKQSKPED